MKKVLNKVINFINLQLFVNTITLAEDYLAVLDAIYETETLTNGMQAPAWLRKAGQTAKTILIAKVTVDGLKNYSRSSGYLEGDNTFEWEQHTYSIDRGIEFSVDKADDMETIDMAFAAFSTEFMRTKAVPEVDAYRFATVAGRATASATIEGTLSKADAVEAWDDMIEYMENTKVPKSRLLCYLSPTIKKYFKQSDLIERQFMVQSGFEQINREVDSVDGLKLNIVPQDRFYTEITLQTGSESGYIKTPTTGADINFLVVDAMAALADKKIDSVKIFDPLTNQDKDAWKFQYRLYHDIFTPDNKVDGIYVHHKPAV